MSERRAMGAKEPGGEPDDRPTADLWPGGRLPEAVLAFFIECACPPDRRSATVGAGDIKSVDEFLDSYPLTHIVCQTCDTYYQLIGYIDDSGTERRVGPFAAPPPEATRRARRSRASLKSRN